MATKTPNQPAKSSSSLRFWTTLALINIAVMIYPVATYAQAEADSILFSAVMMVGTAFALMITDAVSAVLALMQ